MLNDHFISVGKETSNDIIDLSMDCSDTDSDISIEKSNDYTGYERKFATYNEPNTNVDINDNMTNLNFQQIKREQSLCNNVINDNTNTSQRNVTRIDREQPSSNNINNNNINISQRNVTATERSLTHNQRTISINENDTLQQTNVCSNCKKYSEDSIYIFNFSSIRSSNIKNRRSKHKYVHTNGGESFYNLCNKCRNYLTIKEPNEYKMKFIHGQIFL